MKTILREDTVYRNKSFCHFGADLPDKLAGIALFKKYVEIENREAEEYFEYMMST